MAGLLLNAVEHRGRDSLGFSVLTSDSRSRLLLVRAQDFCAFRPPPGTGTFRLRRRVYGVAGI